APVPSEYTLPSCTVYKGAGHATGVGTPTAPVTDPQCPAVSTHWGEISVPVQPNAPPMRMSATYVNVPGAAGCPPTTAFAGAACNASAHSNVARTPARRI